MSAAPAAPRPPPLAAHRPIHTIGEALVETGPAPGPFAPPTLMLLRPGPMAPTHVKLAGSHFVPATQPPPTHIADPGVVPVAHILGHIAPVGTPSPLTPQVLQADKALLNTGISPNASNTLMLSDQALHQLQVLVSTGKISMWQRIQFSNALHGDKTGKYGADCSGGTKDGEVLALLEDINNRGFMTAMSDTTATGHGLASFARPDAPQQDLRAAMNRAEETRGAFYNWITSAIPTAPPAHPALLPLVNEIKRKYDEAFRQRPPLTDEQRQALYEMEAADREKLVAYLRADQARDALTQPSPSSPPPQLTPAQGQMVRFLEGLQVALVPVQPPPGTPSPARPQFAVTPAAMKALQEQLQIPPPPASSTSVALPPAAVPPPPDNPAVFEIFKPDNHFNRTLVAVAAPSLAPPPPPASATAAPAPSPRPPPAHPPSGASGPPPPTLAPPPPPPPPSAAALPPGSAPLPGGGTPLVQPPPLPLPVAGSPVSPSGGGGRR